MNRAILFSKFIRYDVLDSMIKSNPSAIALTKAPVDVYIDIQSVYKLILSENLLTNDYKVLSVNILNLAGHYRHYFKSRYGVSTRIYIVNALASLDNITSQLNAGNRDMFAVVQKIAQYFPSVYFINKENYNGSAIILSLLQSETIPEQHASLIISNDIYSYQIPAYVPSSFLIRPSSNTKFITHYNVIDLMYPRKSVKTVTSDLNPALIPVIMAYHKCPELGMEMLNNFKTTLSIIRDKISKNQILNGYNSPVMFKGDTDDIVRRLYLSDLMTIARTYSNSYEALVNSWKIYKQCDFSALANVLDKTFNTDENNLLNYLFLLE